MKSNNSFYITTAIDYPNSDPHLGHAYEKIIADVFARWNRLKGKDVVLSYGLDEHGQKIQDTAKSKGMEPKDFVKKQHDIFKNFVDSLLITYDELIRTSDNEEHKALARDIFSKVLEKGEIYKGEYKGNYCKYEEAFYTDMQLDNGKCPECGRETKVVSEEAYFFKMGLYQEKLIKHIEENPEFIIPETRKNEILSRLKSDEVRDLCVSRSSFDWGIKLPNDESHIIYVWFDALLNYLTAIKFKHNEDNEHWPADVQVIGKDIIWFHTVIWPSMLMSLDIPLPKTVYAHGFINDAEGKAMSKSLGNGADPIEMLNKYGVDALRFYLMRSIPSGEDGNFDEKELISKYNKELGNDLGNLLKRLQVLTNKYFDGKLSNNNFNDDIKIIDSFNLIDEQINKLSYNRALDLIWSELRRINAYMNEKEPWKNEEGRESVMYNALDNLRIVTHYLYPYIPKSASVIANQLGFDFVNFSELSFGTQNYDIKVHDVLYPKIEEEKEQKELPKFTLNLRVGKILDVQKHPEADKLYIEKISYGSEESQVVSGLAEHFTPEELIGKNVIIVSNLKKAKLRGVESYGMLLVAQNDNKMVLLQAPNSEPGDYVTLEGHENRTSNIKYEDFASVKLDVKNGVVMSEGKELKTSKEAVKADIEDGAKIS
ncbi:methionine--tRNA ligase [Candidatus Woesearchaeota archaeon]|nr:methionine--tRNA ligase [Candidatus Woesearchaeota archaeon]